MTSDADDLLRAVTTSLESTASVMLLIDPTVRHPTDIARRVTRNWPQLPVFLALDADDLLQARKLLERGDSQTSRWTVGSAAAKDLAQALTEVLDGAATQRTKRANLDRMKARLSANEEYDASEYEKVGGSDRYLLTALHSASDAVVSLDQDGSVLSWNGGAERLFGLTKDQSLGIVFSRLFEDPASVDSACSLAALDGHARTIFKRSDKSGVRHLEASVDRVCDLANFPLGVLITLRDVTARQEAHEAQQATYAMKDQFFVLLGHELRNPLAPIRTAAELLNRLDLPEKRAQFAIRTLLNQTKLMASLLDDLLDVTRLSRGNLELALEPVLLSSVIEDSLEQARPLMDSKRQHITVRAPSDHVCEVLGDRKRLVQVVSNLLTNASKYSDEGGKIDLSLQPAGDLVHIVVEDNGIGLDSDMSSRVFELFSQAQAGHERSRGGLGLGLALVKALVERHGGSVSVSSPGPGLGSKFSVTLPLNHSPAQAAAMHR